MYPYYYDRFFIWRTPQNDGKKPVMVDGLSQQGPLPCGLFLADEIIQTARTHTLGRQWAGFGHGLFSLGFKHMYWGVDESGEIVWYLHDGDSASMTPNIRQIEPGVWMVFLADSVRTITPAGVTIQDYALSTVGRYHHDAIRLPSGNLLVLGSEIGTFNDATLAGDKIVIKIDHMTGDIIWILGAQTGAADGFDEAFFTLADGGTWMTGQHAGMLASDGDVLL